MRAQLAACAVCVCMGWMGLASAQVLNPPVYVANGFEDPPSLTAQLLPPATFDDATFDEIWSGFTVDGPFSGSLTPALPPHSGGVVTMDSGPVDVGSNGGWALLPPSICQPGEGGTPTTFQMQATLTLDPGIYGEQLHGIVLRSIGQAPGEELEVGIFLGRQCPGGSTCTQDSELVDFAILQMSNHPSQAAPLFTPLPRGAPLLLDLTYDAVGAVARGVVSDGGSVLYDSGDQTISPFYQLEPQIFSVAGIPTDAGLLTVEVPSRATATWTDFSFGAQGIKYQGTPAPLKWDTTAYSATQSGAPGSLFPPNGPGSPLTFLEAGSPPNPGFGGAANLNVALLTLDGVGPASLYLEESFAETQDAFTNFILPEFPNSTFDAFVEDAFLAQGCGLDYAPNLPAQPPWFTPGGDVTVAEDAGPQTLPWATDLIAGDTLSFDVSADAPGLFQSAPAVDPSSGELSVEAAPNAFGSTLVTVTLCEAEVCSDPATFTLTITAEDDPPSFVAGPDQLVDEDAGPQSVLWAVAVSPGPLEGAVDSASFVVSNDAPALFAIAPSIAPDGTLTYTPAADAHGSANVTAQLFDEGGQSTSPATFVIDVAPVNDPPSFTAGPDQSVPADGLPRTVAAWATDISPGPADEAAQPLSFTVTTDAPELFAAPPAISPDGTLTYTPAQFVGGVATVTVVLSDGTDDSAPATFLITSVFEPPSFTIGVDQGAAEDAGLQTVPGWATDISAGTPAGTASFVATAADPSLFSVLPAVDASGTLTWQSAPDANGSTTVELVLVRDDDPGQSSAPQTFTITVDPVNDPPSFTAGADAQVLEDAGAQLVPGWASNISAGPANEAAQSLTFSATTDNPALFSAPPAVDASGALSFTPAADANGTATVTLTLSDDGTPAQTAVATFTITVDPVNDPPSFTAGPDVEVAEDAGSQTFAAWATDISAGPANEASQLASFTVTTDAPELFAVAPAVSADGTLSFEPAPDQHGSASVTITLVDEGGGSDTSPPSVVTLTITSVNDPPSFVPGGDQVVLHDSGPVSTLWATSISAGPADEADQTLSFSVSVDAPELFAVPPAIAPDGTLSYEPIPLVFGVATVTVSLSDGVDSTPPQTFTVEVTFVPAQPSFSAGPDIATVEDAGPQLYEGWATGITSGTPPGPVEFLVSHDNPALFAVEPSIDTSGALTFEAAPDAHGSATLTIVLAKTDGSDTSEPATATLTVAPVNDPPSFAPGDAVTVDEDAGEVSTAWATELSPGPADEAGQALSFTTTVADPSLFSTPPALTPEGTLSFTPAPDQNGSTTVTVVLSDDEGAESPPVDFELTITALNDPPSFTPGGDIEVAEDSGAYLAAWAEAVSAGPPTATDESGQPLSFTLTTDADALFSLPPAIDADGTLSFTPAPNANGLATVSVTLSDGVDQSAPASFTIAISAVNDPPSFVAGPDLSADEDAGPQTVTWASEISAGPPDEAAQPLSFDVTLGPDAEALFAVAPALAADGTLTYTPADDANGSALVSVTLTDGALTTEPQTFTLTISPVDDAPTLTLGPDVEAAEDAGPQELLGWATASAGPPDEAGQALVYTVTTDAPELFEQAPSVSAEGTLSFTPAPDVFGVATLTVSVSDGTHDSAPESATLTLTPVNDAPGFLGGEAPTSIEDAGPQTVPGWASAISPGPDNESEQPVTFTLTTDRPELFVEGPALSPEGTLSWTTAPDGNGDALVTIVASDGIDDSPPLETVLSVTPVNDAPSFTAGGDLEVTEDAGSQLSVWATDITPGPDDESEQSVTFEVTSDVEGAFTTPPSIDPAGFLTFETAPDYAGLVTLTVVARDDGGADLGGVDTSAPASFTISVVDQLDAPTPTIPVGEDGTPLVLTTDEDTPLPIELQVEDAGGADAELVWTITTAPEHGTLEGDAPALVYIPDADFNGADSFGFTVSNAAGAAPEADVLIDVLPVNDPPVFVEPTPTEPVSVVDSAPLTFTLAASDVDGPELSFSADGMPQGAALAPDSGEFTWVPQLGDLGQHALTAWAHDGVDSVSQLIVIEVAALDADGDGLPDTWEVQAGLDPGSVDSDGDTIDDATEVGDWTTGGLDSDGDETLDALDLDADDDGLLDASEAGDEDLETPPRDTDGDGNPDYRDADSDDDSVGDDVDNCVLVANPDQLDTDGDLTGDACDDDDDGDGLPDDLELEHGLDPKDFDSDDDAIPDDVELGDGESPADSDGDGTIDALDTDSDGDGLSDEQEAGDGDLGTPPNDTDGDGLPDFLDPDSDNDQVGDAEDNCALVGNPDQSDANDDGAGDECDDDSDGDGQLNEEDNCHLVANPDQADADGDGAGDLCDSDDDDDGVLDIDDNCERHANPDQSDADGDGLGDLCDPDFVDGSGVKDQGCECRSGGADPSVPLALAFLVIAAGLRRRGEARSIA